MDFPLEDIIEEAKNLALHNHMLSSALASVSNRYVSLKVHIEQAIEDAKKEVAKGWDQQVIANDLAETVEDAFVKVRELLKE